VTINWHRLRSRSKPAYTASRIGISANQTSGIYIRLRKAGRLKRANGGGYVVGEVDEK
jgi:predicted transcriptional regulator of viral defense system